MTTPTTTTTSALFRVDPTEGLVKYVQSIKPYHSKILDVFVEYVYGERMNATVTDRVLWTFGFDGACAQSIVTSIDLDANTITVIPNDAPSFIPGSTLAFKHSSYYPGDLTFTVISSTYGSDYQVTIEVGEPLRREYMKPINDRLNDAEIVNLVTGGTIATNCGYRQPVLYTCGFGHVWELGPDTNPTVATITKAVGAITQQVLSVVGTTLTIAADPSGFVYGTDVPVILSTTGTMPPNLIVGQQLYATGITTTTVSLSSVVGGAPITLAGGYTGTLLLRPILSDLNTFTVSTALPTSHAVSVTSVDTNQLAFTQSAVITGCSPSLSTWTVVGNLSHLVAGDRVYVNDNATQPANKPYTVASVTFAAGITTIQVRTPIPGLTTTGGRLSFHIDAESIPLWPTGAAVKLTAAGSVPTPTLPSVTYYFVPTQTLGVFNLSTVRYPTKYEHIVNLESLGVGAISITRVEPFVPGDRVKVTGSDGTTNDGDYVISSIVSLSPNTFRIATYQSVPKSTPSGVNPDGTLAVSGSFGDPYCAVASSDRLHIATVFTERLQFEFGDDTDTGPDESTSLYDVQPFF